MKIYTVLDDIRARVKKHGLTPHKLEKLSGVNKASFHNMMLASWNPTSKTIGLVQIALDGLDSEANA